MALLLCVSVQAQDDGKHESPDIDRRVYDHYTKAQIDEMRTQHPEKLRQLNYYYRDSWYVREAPGCTDCPAVDLSAFDVQEWESRRHWSREETIQLTKPGHFIVLKPRKLIQEAYQQMQ